MEKNYDDLLEKGFCHIQNIFSPSSECLIKAEEIWKSFKTSTNEFSKGQRLSKYEFFGLKSLESLMKMETEFGAYISKLTPNIKLLQSEINLLNGHSEWHRDGKYVPRHAYRVAWYLDDTTLSFIPYSHLEQSLWSVKEIDGLNGLANFNHTLIGGNVKKNIVTLKVKRNDLVIFNSGIIHASFPKCNTRRQIAYVYIGNAISLEDKLFRTKFCLNRILTGTTLFY